MSKVFKAFIVEDEPMAIALLKDYIEKVDFLDLVGETRNPLKAFSCIQQMDVDVLFLDINMPNLNGIDLYKSFGNPPKVIFTTSYGEYAVEGFELEAVDYLLKPISFPRFLKACHKLTKGLNDNTINNESFEKKLTDFIYIKSGVTSYKVSWQEVWYLEKSENYVIYHTKDKRILSRQTLTNAEYLFPSYFCRIHKSYAVSLIHINKVEREFLYIQDKSLPISRSYREQFIKKLNALNK